MAVTYASFTLALDVFVTNYSCGIINKRSGSVSRKKIMSRTSVLDEIFVHARGNPHRLCNN